MSTIRVKLALRSLPKRNVIFSVELINEDFMDYYFNTYNLASVHSGMIAINNTHGARHHGMAWQSCLSITCPSRAQESDFYKIPAYGIYTKEVNIVLRCGFLKTEPLGYEHWMRFNHGPVPLVDAPMGNWVGGVTMPSRIELPFVLIDEEERSADELIDASSHLGSISEAVASGLAVASGEL